MDTAALVILILLLGFWGAVDVPLAYLKTRHPDWWICRDVKLPWLRVSRTLPGTPQQGAATLPGNPATTRNEPSSNVRRVYSQRRPPS